MRTQKGDNDTGVYENQSVGHNDERRAWGLSSRNACALLLIACEIIAQFKQDARNEGKEGGET
jgi:hypothetical protein